jgi:uncharacterized secreted protein with C-terminal beta-propeller domain
MPPDSRPDSTETTGLPTGTLAVVAVVALLVGAAVGATVFATVGGPPTAAPSDPSADDRTGGTPGGRADPGDPTDSSDRTDSSARGRVAAFDSAAAFRAYLRDAPADATYRVRPRPVEADVVRDDAVETVAESAPADAGGADAETTAAPTATATPMPTSTPAASGGDAGGAGGGSAAGPERRSNTNVQEAGIDEPDLVKTRGATTIYSRPAGTVLLNTTDPAAPAVASRVPVSGRLLVAGDTMLVFTGEDVVAYDVADRSDPERRWRRGLDGRVVAARLANGTTYVVVRDALDRSEPCPVEPMDDVRVPCDRIYRPTEPVPVDATYSVLSLRPADGNVTDAVSFVGSARTAATYVSRSGVYVTYRNATGEGEAYLDYLRSDRVDLPADVASRLRELRSYDLSDRSMRLEAERALRSWYASLDEFERERTVDEVRAGWRAYREAHKRDLVRTGVVRVEYGGSAASEASDADAANLSVAAVGSVPGVPLNQFSMDEHDGHLRIATTVAAPGTTSANDVYVLDAGTLDVEGSVRDMGLTERVYSVRFVGDTGYVVTFRRVDPFHVLDLSEPGSPELRGELKLPGFSSYLHPLPDERVLGIGEEDGRVKAVVFDVSDPTDPVVADDRVLDARWSAVAESHHAFLLDPKHGVFFLPTERAGYVYGYEGEGLDLKTRVDVEGARRAVYLDDQLYVFGRDRVVVVDEETWRETTRLPLGP